MLAVAPKAVSPASLRREPIAAVNGTELPGPFKLLLEEVVGAPPAVAVLAAASIEPDFICTLAVLGAYYCC